MQKVILLLCACTLVFRYGHSQPVSGQDSSPVSKVKAATGKTAQSITLQPELAIYPNPARNKITVQVKQFSAGMVAVKVLDSKGKLVREEKRLLTNGTEDIVMFLMLKAGIYFIMVTEPGKVARKKLVIL
jgi:hypothetical protein